MNVRCVKRQLKCCGWYNRLVNSSVADKKIIISKTVFVLSVFGTGTTRAVFIVRQLEKQYLGKKRKLHLVSVDLGKAFGRVLRDVEQ